MRSGILYKFGRFSGVILLAALLCSGCSGARTVTESVKFAILGNTSPESPFSGFTKSLPELLSEIESRKPQIIIHSGNAIYGGSEEEGILESDVRRQLNIFFPILRSLNTAVYSIPGERDFFNGSTSLYTEISGKASAYSFNYGSIHFICLSSSGSAGNFIDDAQFEWLKKDLGEFSDSNAVFVFAYHQMFPDKKKVKASEQSEELHSLFLKYKVRAVFSSSGRDYNTKIRDSINYINTGYQGTTAKKDNKKSNRYYLVNFINNEIIIDQLK